MLKEWFNNIKPKTRRAVFEFSLWTLALLLAISSIPVFAQEQMQQSRGTPAPLSATAVNVIVAEYEMNIQTLMRRAAALAVENVALQDRIRELESKLKPPEKTNAPAK